MVSDESTNDVILNGVDAAGGAGNKAGRTVVEEEEGVGGAFILIFCM